MNEILLLGISFVVLFIGAFVGYIFAVLRQRANQNVLQERSTQLDVQLKHLREQLDSQKKAADQQYDQVCREREQLREEKDLFRNQLTQRNSELENLQEKLQEQKLEVERLQEKFTKEFENLAQKILDHKSEKFTSLNQKNLQSILNPLQEKIRRFEEKVEKNSFDFVERHAELGKQLDLLNQQNLRISEEANNLTKALKGENKTQGNWGELILERVLEKSGLAKDREYFVQQSHKDEEGNKRLPDVVLHLPGNKRMVIDAKVSLTAYEKYVNADGEEFKRRYLKEHLRSLNNHISDLSSKKYEDLYKISSPDFVLLFIPVEPALYLAQNSDSSFFYTAFQKNILLVSPTTLLSVLRTIDALWSNEKQQENALEIARHASSLYHKFKILLDDLDKVGDRLKSTSSAYDNAMKKLTGKQNLIKDIDKLETLGISPKQRLAKKWTDLSIGSEENNNNLN